MSPHDLLAGIVDRACAAFIRLNELVDGRALDAHEFVRQDLDAAALCGRLATSGPYESERELAARVAALEAALDRITRFVDYTVREWIGYTDDHQNCDSSCAHRAAVDRQYETVEEIVTAACAALARPTPTPQGEQG